MTALSGEKTLAELSAEFGVHPTMISGWKLWAAQGGSRRGHQCCAPYAGFHGHHHPALLCEFAIPQRRTTIAQGSTVTMHLVHGSPP
jgi:hypothetical protein